MPDQYGRMRYTFRLLRSTHVNEFGKEYRTYPRDTTKRIDERFPTFETDIDLREMDTNRSEKKFELIEDRGPSS